VPTTGTTATEQTTSNLITSGTTHTWTGVTTGTLPANYMPGGPSPIYDPATNTISFSYNAQATVAQTIAINNALANAGAGVKINGYNYSYDVRNMNGDNRQGGTDTLNVYQSLVSTTGTNLLSSQQTYNTRFDWTSVTGTQTAGTPIDMANASYLKFRMVGGDNGYWAGYFGPQVRNVNMSLNYTVDQCAVNPQSSPSCPGFKTFYNISDDGYAQVNLPFAFPFYGRTFSTSYFFSNGVVGFLDPNTHGNGFCCDGVNLNNNPGSPWNFAIYALQTDLIAANANAKFYTQSDPTYMKYTWENVNEYGTQNLNTFSTTIKPTGYIGINHQQVNVQYHNVTTGIAGDIAAGQYSQYYNGAGSAFPIPSSTLVYGGNETNICYTNPLSSPSCPNYTDAMCQINPLYSQTCAGYQSAYFSQQCSLNSLYDVNCPGYAAAYLDYQCSRDPLYATQCSGYEQAYHDQQCRLDPLYARDCTGYAVAYHDQQCSINPLFATDCVGYGAAYLSQQCGINPLYSTQCTGYAAAYFTQQCNLNGLYDRTCPNYNEAYAKKMLLEQQNLASTVATAGVVAATAPAPTTTTSTTDSSGEIKVAVVADQNVNNVITTTATSASPAQAATATVPLVAAPPPAVEMKVEMKAEPKQEERKPDAPNAGVQSNQMAQGASTETKPAGPTARQELAERRQAAAKAEAVEKGKNLAKDMGKAADMESQKQVQNVVIQAMGFTPGFDAYGKAMIPQTIGYKPFTVYNNQVNVDNRRLGMGLYGPSDRLHNELVDSQYKGE
jgi:hypothetical protein